MDNLNELKAIWQTAKVDELPSAAEILQQAKKFRNQKIRNKVLSIIVGITGTIAMSLLLITMPVLMLCTRLGIVFILFSCIILIYTNARSIRRFIRLNDCSNKEFISFLEQTQRNQLYYYKYTQVLGLLFSSIGLLLYLYEFVHRNITLMIIFYVISLAWILFLWFYQRPRSFKKHSRKLNAMLHELNKITDQLQ